MAQRNPLKIFSGSSHPQLAQAIADHLKMPLSPMEIKCFASGEIYAKPGESVRGCDVFVIQSATERVNEDMMELFIMLDAFKRSFAHSIHVVMPYYAYGRQDRVASPREPISARLMADLISTAGATHLITLSLHSGQTQGFFSFPVDNLHAHTLFADYFKKKKLKNVVMVATDAGGAKAAKRLADCLNTDIAIVNKNRPGHNQVEVLSIVGDVKGKIPIIFDDMIDTGGSVVAAAQALREAGAQDEIYLGSIHAVFSPPCVDRLRQANFKEIIVTDSLPLSPEKRLPNMRFLTVAPLLGKVIHYVHEDRSISPIMKS
ncbi:MAG: Ribose-phosphate pyrophosphokinase [Candidatus Peregrinibacteria bacterium GW2011_GWA2_44_7]|nr:MAG: Ribose-phosphate pyrophosphokinase [Candidatus Peregrinibacteria bacterium GW2011_GWA2_44_7]